jgi:sporulation protein YlmC with PRC-barrel domain
MRKARKIDAKVVVAALYVATAGWMLAQAQDNPGTGVNQAPQQPATPTPAGPMLKINRCSQLIGSTVENPQGDKLGKIDEVVLDIQNRRVSYCVMSVEHKLFATPKYLAVPWAAFGPSADGSHLILNANKEQVAQAQGFDRNNLPSVTNSAWGAQPFWTPAQKTPMAVLPDQKKDSTPGDKPLN